MADFVHGFEGTTVDQMDLPVLLDEFFERLRAHKIRFPAELVLLVKSLTTIQSVARSLDPDFDMITHLRPYVKRVLTKRYGKQLVASLPPARRFTRLDDVKRWWGAPTL